MKPSATVYVVRHCQAAGQEPAAPLTPAGSAQAEALAEFLLPLGIERIVSSPFTRAVHSIAPLAARLRLEVEQDARLRERALGEAAPDWLECLRRSFDDLDLCFAGGESSREAMRRAVAAVDDLLRHATRKTLIVSHGNLIALLLRHFDPRVGFETWQALTNPDVFCVTLAADGASITRLWQQNAE